MDRYYLDISHHKSVTDWSQLSALCPFIITKATQGTTYVDTKLKEFVKNFELHKLPYWLYVYLNKGDEVKQVDYMIQQTEDLVGDHFVGYILDVEEDNTLKGVRNAVARLDKTPYRKMIYYGWKDYAKYKDLLTAELDKDTWEIWEARYGDNDGTYKSKYPPHTIAGLHQYSSEAKIPFLKGSIDINRITGKGHDEAWFATPYKVYSTPEVEEPKTYQGEFPKLPARGYFRYGDGFATGNAEVKKLQKFLNWALDANLKVDGAYGNLTIKAVSKFQKLTYCQYDGIFGKETLGKAKLFCK